MGNTFYIKQNDTSPALVYTLPKKINLTGATAVFNMKPITVPEATPIERAPATISSDNKLGFEFEASHTALPGVYRGEFEITYADASVETYPNTGFITIKVTRDLG